MIQGLEIEIDGARMKDEAKAAIQSVEISDEVGTKSDQMTIRFSDPGGAIKKPKKGVVIKPFIADAEGKLILMGRFVFGSFGDNRGVVTVKAKGFDGRKSIKNTFNGAYANKTVKEVVEEVAKRNGLTAKVAPDFGKEKRYTMQQGESDVSFLDRLAKENSATFKTQGKEILFVPKGLGRSSKGENLPIIELIRTDLCDWDYSDDDRDDFGEVNAKYFDVKTGLSGEVTVGAGEPKKTLPVEYHSEADARAAIGAAKKDAQDSQETLVLTTAGNPHYKAERRIRLKGYRSYIDGVWVVNGTKHKLGPGHSSIMTLKRVLLEE